MNKSKFLEVPCSLSLFTDSKFFKGLAKEVSGRVDNKIIDDAGRASEKTVGKSEREVYSLVTKHPKDKQKRLQPNTRETFFGQSSAQSVRAEATLEEGNSPYRDQQWFHSWGRSIF